MRISDWSSDVCSSDLAQRIEAERVEACREMLGNRRRDIERAAIGMVDTQPAAVQVQLAADRAGQKGGLAAIFAVADDRVADRRQIGRAACGERVCQSV